MKSIVKDYNLTIDYCAFMVAIVIICQEVNSTNARLQWCAEELAGITNALPRAQHADFHVNPLALKQELLLFKRYLTVWGISAMEIYQEDRRTLDFFHRGESRRSVELKFGTYQSLNEEKSNSEVLNEIMKMRDKLLLLGGYEKSIHETPCSLFGVLYLPLAINPSPVKDSPKSPSTYVRHASTNDGQFMTKQLKVRKSPTALGLEQFIAVQRKFCGKFL